MKLNLTVKTTKNYQTIELSATDIEIGKYVDTKNWLIKEAQNAINQLVPGENYTQQVRVYDPVPTNQTNYQPVQQTKGALASQKQVNFLRSLGYQGSVDGMSVSEANDLIKNLKENEKNKK